MKPKTVVLLAVLVFGIIYCGWVYSKSTMTGVHRWDGIIGVVLGLYICSHPAANFVDLLFYRRGLRYPFSSGRSVLLWLGINMMVLLIGGIAIFFGTTRLIGGTG